MLSTFVCLLLIVNVYHIEAAGAGPRNWCYLTGKSDCRLADDWKNLPNSTCGGVRQSPIDIITKDVVKLTELKPIKVTGATESAVDLKNTGSSITLGFNTKWIIKFGTDGALTPVQIHWHWGSKSDSGSEHTINGMSYPLEGHIVCYNSLLYTSFEKAFVSPSGLYVIGVLYKVGNKNPALQKIVPEFAKIINADQHTSVPEIDVSEFLPKSLNSYYRYEGSLTTPPCTENVIWTLMSEPVEVSEDQLVAFRNLKFGLPDSPDYMMKNFRPTIPTPVTSDYIKRVVYFSSTMIPPATDCYLFIITLIIGIYFQY